MQIQDKDTNDGIVSCFRSAVKSCRYFFHVAFLECCKHVDVVPAGLRINKTPFVAFLEEEMQILWDDTIASTQSCLHDQLIIGVRDQLFAFEESFWDQFGEIILREKREDIESWLIKLLTHLDKEHSKIFARQKRKLHNLTKSDPNKQTIISERFDEHFDNFWTPGIAVRVL